MQDLVNEWLQDGRLWIWQYADANRSWNGWHFAADPKGSGSIRDLLDRMNAGEACHRTLHLEFVSDSLTDAIGYDRKYVRQFDKLRLQFSPRATDLSLYPGENRLVMTVGKQLLPQLASAFAEVQKGGGDFGIATSERKRSERWMFWWPPRDVR